MCATVTRRFICRPHTNRLARETTVSRPGLRHICMRAVGPFPLFHYNWLAFQDAYKFVPSYVYSCKNNTNVKFVLI